MSTARGPQRGPSLFSLAARQGWRDLRAGDLRLLILAVCLAVAALTSVGFFSQRLAMGLQRDAGKLLGGDSVVVSDRPDDGRWRALAERHGLRWAQSASFPSMARAPDEQGGEARLAAIKAVGPLYPLRGSITLNQGNGQAVSAQAGGPAAGTTWVDAAVLDALGLQLGDALELGDARLRIAARIELESDRGAGFMNFAPRVMINQADLPATGLIQAASRVSWRLAVAGDETAVKRFNDEANRMLAAAKASAEMPATRLESLESGRPEMRQTLDRAMRFLDLVAALAAILCAVALAIGARDFAQRHLDDSALLRVLGQSRRQVMGLYALEYLGVGLLASALGVALGWLAHGVFVAVLGAWLTVALPPASWQPAAFGLGVGMTLLVAFGLPPVVQMAGVSPLRIIRRDLGLPSAGSLGVLAAGLAGFAALVLMVAPTWVLGLSVLGGLSLAVLLFAGLAGLCVVLLRRATPRLSGMTGLSLAVRQITARAAFTVTQVTALSIGLLALVLLILIRTDLLSSWQKASPPDAPDRFVINIQPDQAEAFREALKQAGVTQFDWYPMIRGRLVAVNGRTVTAEDYVDERARRLVEREFNLSHAARAPDHNRIQAGAWVEEEADGLSLEEGLAKTLGVKLGDRLRFDIAGTVQESRITSLRAVDWASMRVNFFAMFPRSSLPDVPVTWITAFKAPAQAAGFDRSLAKAFPNVTVVDVSASLAQVQSVLAQVSRAVEFLFAFTVAAGLIVLVSTIVATRAAREREQALMRALGASRALMTRVLMTELLGLGALAGFLASAVALASAWALATWVFEFAWTPLWWALPAGAASGALLSLAAAWWGLRRVLQQPVLSTLRRSLVE